MPTKHKSRIYCTNSLAKKLDNFVSARKCELIKKVTLFFSTNPVSFLFKLDLMRKIEQNLIPELLAYEDPSLLLKNLADQFHIKIKNKEMMCTPNIKSNFIIERNNILYR